LSKQYTDYPAINGCFSCLRHNYLRNYKTNMGSLLIRNIRSLVQIETVRRNLVKGPDMANLPSIEDAYLLAENGRIAAFGPMSACPDRADETLDATGRMVLPSWCDSHTHLVFAATREEEFVDRIRGLSYEEIAGRGGGILNSARKLEAADEDSLFRGAWQRLQEVIGFGTGAIEIKSGYGLTFESEIKMLRVIRRLKEASPIPIKATFLGAHAIPMAYQARREAYIQLIVEEMLPQVAGEGLADYCDVFCDKGFFTPEETDQILQAGWKYGLKPKIHANELGITGGVQVGVANRAISVDHLEHTSDIEIELLKNSDTLPTLLPSCAFFLGIPYPEARKMIDAGLPVVLATDYNPGSSPSGNMPFVVSLACIRMKMLPEEAINAATLNGARAMELEDEVGTIAIGKKANLFTTIPLESLALIPYSFGGKAVETVILNGKVL
jgi:imidazolonepropionase